MNQMQVQPHEERQRRIGECFFSFDFLAFWLSQHGVSVFCVVGSTCLSLLRRDVCFIFLCFVFHTLSPKGCVLSFCFWFSMPFCRLVFRVALWLPRVLLCLSVFPFSMIWPPRDLFCRCVFRFPFWLPRGLLYLPVFVFHDLAPEGYSSSLCFLLPTLWPSGAWQEVCSIILFWFSTLGLPRGAWFLFLLMLQCLAPMCSSSLLFFIVDLGGLPAAKWLALLNLIRSYVCVARPCVHVRTSFVFDIKVVRQKLATEEKTKNRGWRPYGGLETVWLRGLETQGAPYGPPWGFWGSFFLCFCRWYGKLVQRPCGHMQINPAATNTFRIYLHIEATSYLLNLPAQCHLAKQRVGSMFTVGRFKSHISQ